MTKGPKRINRNELAARALQQMEEYSITSLFVFEENGSGAPTGVIHLHDLLKAGIA
jgi:arabinose-5-phosphate isomerase